MSEFIRILEIVLPVFLLVIFGFISKKIGLLEEDFILSASSLVFKVFMPINMFVNIYRASGLEIVRPQLILYILFAIFIILILGYSILKKMNIDQETIAVMLQALIRSNIVLFGLSIAKNYFDQDGVSVVAIYIGVISAFTNGIAIILHESLSTKADKLSGFAILGKVMKNTILIAVFFGIAIKILGIIIYGPILKTLDSLSDVATPLGLLCVGGSMKFNPDRSEKKLVSLFLLVKSLILPAIALTVFTMLGFKGPELFFIIILFASPVAVSSHAMSVIYTSKGDFCAKLIVYTTILNSVTIFFAIYILSSLGVV